MQHVGVRESSKQYLSASLVEELQSSYQVLGRIWKVFFYGLVFAAGTAHDFEHLALQKASQTKFGRYLGVVWQLIK